MSAITKDELNAAVIAVRRIAPAGMGDFAVRSMAQAALEAAQHVRQANRPTCIRTSEPCDRGCDEDSACQG